MRSSYTIDANARINIFATWRECWQRRDLIRMLSLRDVKVRYTQTMLGMLWAIINPLVSLVLLLFVFHVVAKVDTGGVPPTLFIVSGLCAWNYFAKVVGESGISIVGAQDLVKKIYFPRLIIPLSKALGGLIDLFIVLIFLAILVIVYHYPVHWHTLLLIPCIVLLFIMAAGFGIWISALTIRFRDFHYIVPVLLRIGMFVSPIAFNTNAVPQPYKWLMGLNPLTGIIDAFRFALFQTPYDPTIMLMSLSAGMVISLLGLYYFVSMEKYIADIV
jgi:lipopolysaccharide transport system permease protein